MPSTGYGSMPAEPQEAVVEGDEWHCIAGTTLITQLIAMGFEPKRVVKAIKALGGDGEKFESELEPFVAHILSQMEAAAEASAEKKRKKKARAADTNANATLLGASLSAKATSSIARASSAPALRAGGGGGDTRSDAGTEPEVGCTPIAATTEAPTNLRDIMAAESNSKALAATKPASPKKWCSVPSAGSNSGDNVFVGGGGGGGSGCAIGEKKSSLLDIMQAEGSVPSPPTPVQHHPITGAPVGRSKSVDATRMGANVETSAPLAWGSVPAHASATPTSPTFAQLGGIAIQSGKMSQKARRRLKLEAEATAATTSSLPRMPAFTPNIKPQSWGIACPKAAVGATSSFKTLLAADIDQESRRLVHDAGTIAPAVMAGWAAQRPAGGWALPASTAAIKEDLFPLPKGNVKFTDIIQAQAVKREAVARAMSKSLAAIQVEEIALLEIQELYLQDDEDNGWHVAEFANLSVGFLSNC
jgi:hypothetical protein